MTFPAPPPLQLAQLGEEMRYRLLVEAVTDYAIYMLDPEGRVVSGNAGAQRLKGYTPAQILGRSFSNFYTEADRATGLPARALMTAATQGRFEAEGWRVRRDGSCFWALVVIDPIRGEDGSIIGYAKVTRDLTERRAAQQALEIGAAACGEFGSYHAEPVDPRSGISEPSIFIFPYGILVNKDGERFTNEAPTTVDACYEPVTRRIFEQRDGMAWTILDARHTRIPNYRLGIRTDRQPVVANSIEELAQKIEVPADRLQATVDKYNAACSGADWSPLKVDHVSTTGLYPPKTNWACPLTEGPFHAYPIISSNVFTFGGLKINTDANVVNSDGDAIPGLFAAGETVGIYYGNYTGATSVLKGLVFGRIAGATAARVAEAA